jgi:Phage tail tube protein
MTASESSYVGLAKQTGKGTPNVTDNAFKYLLFTEGGISPANVVVPLDMEVGGGAMQRSLAKMGVMSQGAFQIIPRPTVLGDFLLGALGQAAAPVQQDTTTAYLHAFTLPANQFSAPYFTVRSNPGGLWGEQFQDLRLSALVLNWKAADYVRGTVAFMGGLPTPNVSTGSWSPAAKVDGGPQFIAPLGDVELPLATDVKVLQGSVAMGMIMPMDEQWITGSYSPDDFEINQRSFVISLLLKISDAALYNKIQYDPANGAAWTANIFKAGSFKLEMVSDAQAGTTYPYKLAIEGNGETGDTANVAWSAAPIALRAGRQITMAVTGTFLADPTAGAPITVSLTNAQSTQY